MDFNAILWWARKQTRVQYTNFLYSGAVQLILPADPMRWGVIMPITSGVTRFQFATAQQTNMAVWAGPGLGLATWTEDIIGDVIQLPLWGQEAGGGDSMTCITMSYSPDRKAVLDAYVLQCLSFKGTP